MATRCTVTATISDPSALLQGNAYVRFRLRRFAGFVPRVLGTLVLAETQIDTFPNGSGAISVNIWGNDNIDPAGTFYTVEWWNQGRITSSGNFLIIGSSIDLDTAPIINPPALPPNVTIQGIPQYTTLETNGVLNGSQALLNLVGAGGAVFSDNGSGTVTLTAGSIDSVQSINSNTSVGFGGASNTLIKATAGVGGISLVLPTAIGVTGQQIKIKKVDSAAGSVTVGATLGQTIDGTLYGSNYVLTNFMQFVVLESDGANWLIVGGN